MRKLMMISVTVEQHEPRCVPCPATEMHDALDYVVASRLHDIVNQRLRDALGNQSASSFVVREDIVRFVERPKSPLDKFRATRERCDDIGRAIKDDSLLGAKGLLYADNWYIERVRVDYPETKGHGELYHLTIMGEVDEVSSNLARLEELLFAHVEAQR